jgi:response regulator RpfG family c-di-GMP phosphodiesterase
MPTIINSGPQRQTPQRQTKDVLLVEPASEARDRHAKMLSRRKYKVTTADNIEQARALWGPNRYGLVVVSLDGFGETAGLLCDDIKDSDHGQVIALIFHPDQELPATDCPTLIFTTEPDEYFLARVETLTAVAYAA